MNTGDVEAAQVSSAVKSDITPSCLHVYRKPQLRRTQSRRTTLAGICAGDEVSLGPRLHNTRVSHHCAKQPFSGDATLPALCMCIV